MIDFLQNVISFFTQPWIKGLFFVALCIEAFALYFCSVNDMSRAIKRLLTLMFSTVLFLAGGTITVTVCRAAGFYNGELAFPQIKKGSVAVKELKENNTVKPPADVVVWGGGGTHNTTSDNPSTDLSMSDLLSVKTNKEKSNEIRKNLSSMSKEKQSEIFNKYASASLYDYWASQTLGGGPDVVDVNVNGTYYSDVAGFDYIIGDDGKTYYCLNRKYRYDEEGNIVEKKNAFDYEDFYDNCWRVLSINN